jgi:pimeloyl-ACP methyl ester carboxylesterase
MGFEPPLPEPPPEGRPGLIPRLRAAGARVLVPDLRGFGASDQPRDPAAYARSAMARDVLALIEHLGLKTVDVLGLSMGSLTAAQLLALGATPVKSAILSGVAQYILEGGALDLPENFPMAGHLPRPLTLRALAEERARVLERGEIIPGDRRFNVAKHRRNNLKGLDARQRVFHTNTFVSTGSAAPVTGSARRTPP